MDEIVIFSFAIAPNNCSVFKISRVLCLGGVFSQTTDPHRRRQTLSTDSQSSFF